MTLPTTGLAATAAYCAPEVAASAGYGNVEGTGAPYGPACDLWSLGVLLYVMLSKRLPFAAPAAAAGSGSDSEGDEGDADAAILARVLEGSVAFAPASAWRGVSDHARDLIQRLLLVDPSERAGWAEVRRHPWCARAIAEREAGLAALERALLPAAEPTAASASAPVAAAPAEEPAAGAPGTPSKAAEEEPGGRALERRAAAAATAAGRLRAILARRQGATARRGA